MKLILFDLDGTLYSSKTILPTSYREGIEEFNQNNSPSVNIPDDETIFDQVGKPADQIYEDLWPELNDAQRIKLQQSIFSNLLKLIQDKKGNLYEGVRTILDQLYPDHTLTVVTNAQTRYMNAVLENHNLTQFFDSYLCNDDAPTGKKSELVAEQLENFSLKPEESLLVGDRESDRNAARQHGLTFVGCTYGYGNEGLFQDEATLQKFEDLPDIIRELS